MHLQRRHTSLSLVIAILVCILGAAGSIQGQTNTSSLTGVVTDQTGALIPGATVTISNTGSGQTQTDKTKSKGEYSFEQIRPGRYEVKASVTGFADQIQKIELLVATPLKLNIKMTLGSTETVTVETSIAEVNSTDATLGKAFNSKQVESLPYLANNVTYLLSLQPGVLALDSGAQTGGLNTDPRTGIVNGARQDQTNITLDGVDNNDQTNGYAFNGALRATRESVEEFRVTTTNANADAGRSSGGQVSLVTRSGTNAFHGTAYEYYRGGVGLANNWFNKQAQLASSKPNIPLKVLQHTYGASLGLPIIKDKLFFFGAYEGFKQASSINVQATVPSLPGGGGLVTGNVTYGACAPGVASCTTPASYKTLTPADIAAIDPKCAANGSCPRGAGTDAASIAFFKTYPTANGTITGDSYNTGSYSFSSPAPIHQITNIARLDYNINSKQVVFVRSNLQSDNQATALPFPGQPPSSTLFGNGKGIAAGHIWTLNSAMTNNFRYGLIRQGNATRGTGSQPYVSFSGLSTITGTSTSSVYIVTTNNFADDFSMTKGRHLIQFGANDRLVSNSRYFDAPLLSSAAISANLLATAAIAGKGTSLDPGAFKCPDCAAVATPFRTFYNAAILANTGIIEQSQSGTEYFVRNNTLVPAGAGVVPTHIYKNLEQEYYIQDQWRVTSHLTLIGGVRYVYLGTPYEKNGQQIAPTVSLNTFLQNRIAAQAAGANYNQRIAFAPSGSANGAPNFWSPQKGNFAPRVSFAYATSDNKTAIRGGFALAYDHVGQGIIDNYESTSSSLLSLSKTNQFTYTNVDTNPRFTDYHNVPLGNVSNASVPLPYAPADNPFTFLRSINDVIKTPYAETFNLSVQHQFPSNLTVTASYVGRLGRHLLANLDVAQPLNLSDPASGQTYFQAATAFDKLIDAGVPAANVPDTGYFHNIFPNASYRGFKGAQAYYAYLAAGDRGNETDPLYNFDTDPSSSAGGASSFRFFFPQTSSIFAQSTVAGSSYNAAQLSVRHALRYGLIYDLNYTYSKSLDQGSSPERNSANLLTNTFAPGQQYAPSDFDVRHNITGDYIIPFPFGRGRPFANTASGFLDRVIGGWQLSGVVHYSSAFPFSASASGNYGTNFDTSSFFVKTGNVPSGGRNYNHGGVNCGSATAGNCVSSLNGISPTQAFSNFRYAYAGETGQRNAFRADGYFSLDNGISKSFRTFREQSFMVKVEVFNTTNSPRFNVLSQGTLTGGNAAQNTNGASTRFGVYTNLLNQPRQMQFSGKYTF